jgi:hypothetical protein
MCDDGDRLLFVLSARREIGWSAFKKAFDDLYAKRLERYGHTNGEPPRFERFRAALLLSALGHCDMVRRGSIRLFAAPAILAALPLPGLPQAIVCGARSPETFAVARKACISLGQPVRLEIKTQDNRTMFAPACIRVEGESCAILDRLAREMGIPYLSTPPAWRFAALSGSLEEYLTLLQWSPESEVAWEREDFRPQALGFAIPGEACGGLRLTRYYDPVHLRFVYRLWKGKLSAEIDPSWGRYAVLQATGTGVMLYDAAAGVAAVPRGAPLPVLLARALTLCSGYAPRFVPRAAVRGGSPERYGFELYDSVPPDVFASIASKVGQEALVQPLLFSESRI